MTSPCAPAADRLSSFRIGATPAAPAATGRLSGQPADPPPQPDVPRGRIRVTSAANYRNAACSRVKLALGLTAGHDVQTQGSGWLPLGPGAVVRQPVALPARGSRRSDGGSQVEQPPGLRG